MTVKIGTQLDPGSVCPGYTSILTPLMEAGQAALAPDLQAGIRGLPLKRLVLRLRNAFNLTIAYDGDDLFAWASMCGAYHDMITKGAEPICATLCAHFTDGTPSCAVELFPPRAPKFQDPARAPQILALLTRRGLTAAQTFALAILLTMVCAVPDACFGDALASDTDDDDPAEDCWHPPTSSKTFFRRTQSCWNAASTESPAS
jgi:hypothetical protein